MITEKQKEILKAIDIYIKANGISPTNRNLCDLLSLKSSSIIHSHLSKLQDEGLISQIDTISRSIKITDKGNRLLKEDLSSFIF